jgi:hypothetical protein
MKINCGKKSSFRNRFFISYYFVIQTLLKKVRNFAFNTKCILGDTALYNFLGNTKSYVKCCICRILWTPYIIILLMLERLLTWVQAKKYKHLYGLVWTELAQAVWSHLMKTRGANIRDSAIAIVTWSQTNSPMKVFLDASCCCISGVELKLLYTVFLCMYVNFNKLIISIDYWN